MVAVELGDGCRKSDHADYISNKKYSTMLLRLDIITDQVLEGISNTIQYRALDVGDPVSEDMILNE